MAGHPWISRKSPNCHLDPQASGGRSAITLGDRRPFSRVTLARAPPDGPVHGNRRLKKLNSATSAHAPLLGKDGGQVRGTIGDFPARPMTAIAEALPRSRSSPVGTVARPGARGRVGRTGPASVYRHPLRGREVGSRGSAVRAENPRILPQPGPGTYPSRDIAGRRRERQTSRAVRRVLSPPGLAARQEAAIHLGPALPPVSCGLPADSGGQPSIIRAGPPCGGPS